MYERKVIEEWIQGNPNRDSGPSGSPLLTRWYVLVNKTKPTICPLTQEPYDSPVHLMPKKTEWSMGILSHPSRNFSFPYEAQALVTALQKTWATYDIPLLSSYFGKEETLSHHSLDLSETHLLVPNRNIQCKKMIQLPPLPRRPLPPLFDLHDKDSHFVSEVHIVKENPEGKSNILPFAHTLVQGSEYEFQNLHALQWFIGFHGKLFTFRNCLFEKCFFDRVCWCEIRMIACKFQECTFDDCVPKGQGYNNLNCEFEKCVVITRQEKSMVTHLNGVQTSDALFVKNLMELHEVVIK
jgi:hypothetical protein